MSEGRITLSSSVQILSVPTGAATQNRSTIPVEISKLSSGTTLKGFVINRDAQNNPIIRTDKGDVSIRSEIFLKTGSEVSLRIEKNMAGVNARLVSVDGQSIKELIQQVSQSLGSSGDSVSKSAIQNSSTQSAAQVASNAAQTALKAILLQPVSLAQIKTLPQALQTLTQNLIEGNNVSVRIVSASPQTTTATAQPTQPNTAQPLQTVAQQQNSLNPAQLSSAYSRYSGGKTSAPTPSATPNTLGAGAIAFQIQSIAASAVRLPSATLPAPLANLFSSAEIGALATVTKASVATVAVPTATNATPSAIAATAPTALPPAVPATTTAQAAPNAAPTTTAAPPIPAALAVSANGTQVTAQVIGNERGGYSTLQTPIGTLRIPAANPLPVGSIITLDLSFALNATQSATTQAPPVQGPSEWLGISRDWTALSSIMAILQDADPALSQQIMQRSFAQSGKSLSKGMLFFLSALRGNSPREWLGANLMQHKDARIQELVKKAMSEFSAMRPMSSDQPDQPWQSAFIPMMHEREPEQLRVFWRDYDKESGNDDKKGERFIIEATLSELGELQFDGLVNTKSTPTSFDLAIRTHAPLDETMKRDIHSLFLSAAEVTGFTGTVRFYEKPEHMEHPLEEIVKALQQKVTAKGVDSRSILA